MKIAAIHLLVLFFMLVLSSYVEAGWPTFKAVKCWPRYDGVSISSKEKPAQPDVQEQTTSTSNCANGQCGGTVRRGRVIEWVRWK